MKKEIREINQVLHLIQIVDNKITDVKYQLKKKSGRKKKNTTFLP